MENCLSGMMRRKCDRLENRLMSAASYLGQLCEGLESELIALLEREQYSDFDIMKAHIDCLCGQVLLFSNQFVIYYERFHLPSRRYHEFVNRAYHSLWSVFLQYQEVCDSRVGALVIPSGSDLTCFNRGHSGVFDHCYLMVGRRRTLGRNSRSLPARIGIINSKYEMIDFSRSDASLELQQYLSFELSLLMPCFGFRRQVSLEVLDQLLLGLSGGELHCSDHGAVIVDVLDDLLRHLLTAGADKIRKMVLFFCQQQLSQIPISINFVVSLMVAITCFVSAVFVLKLRQASQCDQDCLQQVGTLYCTCLDINRGDKYSAIKALYSEEASVLNDFCSASCVDLETLRERLHGAVGIQGSEIIQTVTSFVQSHRVLKAFLLYDDAFCEHGFAQRYRFMVNFNRAVERNLLGETDAVYVKVSVRQFSQLCELMGKVHHALLAQDFSSKEASLHRQSVIDDACLLQPPSFFRRMSSFFML